MALLFVFLPLFFISCSSGEAVVDAEEEVVQDFDLSDQVVVRRTEYGIPHIDAENVKAAGYAMGFVQMEDYGERVPELLLIARGEWAKYNDLPADSRNSAIDRDAANRLDYRRAEETWNRLDQDTRDIMTGFAMGVNRYIELNPDEFDDWVQPIFTGLDVHARGIVSPSGGTIRSFLSALEERRDSETAYNSAGLEANPESQSVWARLAAEEEVPHFDAGSNVWAFAPERTTSGNAILMRNPHLSWEAGYYEAGLKVPGVVEFYGDFRIGGPLGIIGGFNDRLGWSTTNNNPDLDEIYSFDADPDRPDHYIIDGQSVPIEKARVDVEFRHGVALGMESREFLSTPYGPVIHREKGKIYVIKSAGDGEYRTGEQFFRMMKAQNFDEWQDAMKMRARTSSNLTYADADGNIYYVWNATIPIRPHPAGGDTTAIHVTSADQMWSEITPWEDLPQLKNPEGGYVKNENDPFHFTNLNEILHPEDYPDYFPEPQMRLRSQHSHELVHNDQKFSLEDVVELKHSMRMIMADRVLDDLLDAVEKHEPSDTAKEALEMLREWDKTVARDSRGGVLFQLWWYRYRATADSVSVSGSPESVGYAATPEKLFREPWSFDRPVDTPYGLADYERAAESFEWALEEAVDRHGAWDLAWGEVHRAVIDDVDVAVGGCTGLLGCYRILWFNQHRENEQQREVRGGDGWVSAVEFGEKPRAYTILAYGQSIREGSPHNTDQLALFANNEMTPAALTEEEIEAALIRKYRPGQSE
ncbi:MAG: penicillin acylase family protein [Balneolaceae bacterium]|nr:penicillin acylase family protein [Balneolaceae bacterium]MCH8548717.1 penicillin acylase family protein [Balneolaceae bacterium]